MNDVAFGRSVVPQDTEPLRSPSKKYPKYTLSDVEWLGDVPAHWVVRKVTYGFRVIGSGTTPKSDSADYYEGEIPWVTTSELRETVIFETKQYVTELALADYPSLKIYPVGTVLFAMYGATIGRLGMLGVPAAVNQACCAFAWPTLFAPRYVYYWLWMRRQVLIALSSGGGQPNLSQEDLREIRIPTPPLEEQLSIAAFLDRKTAQIDSLVSRKRELIERLKERRQALITQIVTKGLPPNIAKASGFDPTPPLRPSGITWIPDAPVHWQIRRLRHISDAITVGVVVNPSSYVSDEGVPFLLGGDVREFVIDTTTSKRCSEEASNGPLLKSRLSAGDIVVVRVGYPGIAAVVPPELNGSNCASMMIVRQHSRFCSQWLAYMINSRVGRDQVEIVQYGAAQKQFNISHAVDFTYPFPPIAEQRAIAAYLDRKIRSIEEIIAKVSAAVERLDEFRTAILTAAVTGKIDVRGTSA